MDAEAERPDILVLDINHSGRLRRASNLGVDTRPTARRVQLLVQHVETEIGVGGDVPLSARTDPPLVPVVFAVTEGAQTATTGESQSGGIADRRIRGVVVAHGEIAAIQRGAPLLVPEVLVGRVYDPRRGQLDGGLAASAGAAEHAIGNPAIAHTIAIEAERADRAVFRERRVAACTFGIVDLGLQVVARPDHRSEQLEACTDRKANDIGGIAALSIAGQAASRAGIVAAAGVMESAHDLGRTPGLIDAQVGHDIRPSLAWGIATRQSAEHRER